MTHSPSSAQSDLNIETFNRLRKFLDVAASEGHVFDGVDAGDLYMAIFDADDKVSDRLFSDQVRSIAFQELFEFQEVTGCDTAAEARAAASAQASPDGAQKDAWISVDERLPGEGQDVAFIVHAAAGSIQEHLNGRVLGGRFLTVGSHPTFTVPGLGFNASHWQPLSAAPLAATAGKEAR